MSSSFALHRCSSILLIVVYNGDFFGASQVVLRENEILHPTHDDVAVPSEGCKIFIHKFLVRDECASRQARAQREIADPVSGLGTSEQFPLVGC